MEPAEIRINKANYFAWAFAGSIILAGISINNPEWSVFEIILTSVVGLFTMIPLIILIRNKPELIFSESGLWIQDRNSLYEWEEVTAVRTVLDTSDDSSKDYLIFSFNQAKNYEVDLDCIKSGRSELLELIMRYSKGKVPYTGHQHLD